MEFKDLTEDNIKRLACLFVENNHNPLVACTYMIHYIVVVGVEEGRSYAEDLWSETTGIFIETKKKAQEIFRSRPNRFNERLVVVCVDRKRKGYETVFWN